ncbi:hypothetical protein DPMN_055872 [Dreissena polymorpha]|uniref:Uncharacterized protein n=1 Tax=Dreissena polymorpha TaxID=45954 RepID=A0A9D4HSN6_DREPO|nr:hypothetical protein DPMN_055872 [Dreissena polymorpha]
MSLHNDCLICEIIGVLTGSAYFIPVSGRRPIMCVLRMSCRPAGGSTSSSEEESSAKFNGICCWGRWIGKTTSLGGTGTELTSTPWTVLLLWALGGPDVPFSGDGTARGIGVGWAGGCGA